MKEYEILVVEDKPEYLEQAKEAIRVRNETGKHAPLSYIEDAWLRKSYERSLNHFLRTDHPNKLNPSFASCLDEALDLLSNQEFSGCVTDLFFPKIGGSSQEGAYGINVAQYCWDNGIPVIGCTSGHHHGKRYEELPKFSLRNSIGLKNRGFLTYAERVVKREGNYREEFEKDSQIKPWPEAIEGLLYLMENYTKDPKAYKELMLQTKCLAR